MRLGICFFGSIFERTGAGKVVLSFKEGDNIFKSHGISKSTIYSLDEEDKDIISSPINENKITNVGKKIISNLLSFTSIGSYLLVDKLYFGKGERVISKYWDNLKNDDVLVFHEIYTCSAYIDKCKSNKISPKPYILILHTNGEIFKMTMIYYPKLKGSNYEKTLNKRAYRCLKSATKIVFVADEALNNFVSHFPEFESKVHVVHNGITNISNNIKPKFDGSVRMVTVGTVNKRKNQILQVEVLAKIRNKCKVHLDVIGSGDQLEACKIMAKILGVEDLITFWGARDDVSQLLPKCNLFVMTSYDEGLPISGIEALRSHLPVILTDVGGNRELIKQNGFLIRPTMQDLYSAILSYSLSIDRQKEMSDNSYNHYLKSFSIESMIGGYCDLIKEMQAYS